MQNKPKTDDNTEIQVKYQDGNERTITWGELRKETEGWEDQHRRAEFFNDLAETGRAYLRLSSYRIPEFDFLYQPEEKKEKRPKQADLIRYFSPERGRTMLRVQVEYSDGTTLSEIFRDDKEGEDEAKKYMEQLGEHHPEQTIETRKYQ